MSGPVVLIVNPAATRARGPLRAQVVKALTAHGLAAEYETTRERRAGDLARQAVADGAGIVVALGGDGTVNDIAGALADGPVALLPLAGGSTNVFARAMGWPHPATDAVPLLASALDAPVIRTVRLGSVETGTLTRTFCVNAGVGIDANTVQRVESHPLLKQTLRQMSFGLVSVAESVRSTRRDPCITLRADDDDEIELSAVVVAAGSPYAFFGARPLQLTPGAAFDGRLRWMGIEETGPRRLTTVIRGGLQAGSHIGREGISDGWALREVVLSVDHPIALQADGEPLGRFADIRFLPGPRLRVVTVPAQG